MSVDLVIRRARGNPSVGSGASVLAGKLYRQTLAPLFPTAAQYFTTPLRLHARAETVRPDATLVPGAVCGLAHAGSKTICEKWGVGRVVAHSMLPTSHCCCGG